MSNSHQQSSSHDSSVDGIRKRVCKACDRCRLKKSKCDGAHPCSRCKADNAICVFGERKKSHDKIYPKGYVEMLEQQQTQLVSGLQEMYRQLLDAGAWSSSQLDDHNGHPLTHDILSALNLLEVKQDGSGDMEKFEDDCQKLQSRLLSEGAALVHRRGSVSSESEHSQHSHARNSNHGTPTLSKPQPLFKDNFAFNNNNSQSVPHSPLSQSPVAKSKQSFAQPTSSPQQTSPLANDPQLYQAEWAIPDMSVSTQMSRSQFAVQQPDALDFNTIENTLNHGQWNSSLNFDAFSDMTNGLGNMQNMQDFGSLSMDAMDVDFSKFIQVST
ncbi:hypothetical protein K431DRAFT_220005 [Polychaeton citri CBS 116435]|uniref:Zn(2)-C6 fungal-type domain-containing protein n=1 Tax=Polychaeton citri CBS 116435 TaxID=1314669 RepID=A0A9P4US41_9PEZI|nr:hypothetical protein K431DRAFT_220005 [Polychaeton citri CBS 116435]